MDLISVDLKEVIEWLKSRRKLKQNWQQTLQALKRHIEQYARELKSAKIERILINDDSSLDNWDLDYHQIKTIHAALLSSSEGTKKNFLMGYSSSLIKTSFALQKLFEKDFLHAADYAIKANQILSFDIPTCKKQIKIILKEIKDAEYNIIVHNRIITANLEKVAHKVKELDAIDENNSDIDGLLFNYLMKNVVKLDNLHNFFKIIKLAEIINYYEACIDKDDKKRYEAEFHAPLTYHAQGDYLIDKNNNCVAANRKTYEDYFKFKGFLGNDIELSLQKSSIPDVQGNSKHSGPSFILDYNKRNNLLDFVKELSCFLKVRLYEQEELLDNGKWVTNQKNIETEKLSLDSIKEQGLLLDNFIQEVSKPEIFKIFYLLDNPQAKHYIIKEFEKLRHIIYTSKKAIFDTRNFIESRKKELKNCENEIISLKNKILLLRSHLQDIFTENFKARFNFLLPFSL